MIQELGSNRSGLCPPRTPDLGRFWGHKPDRDRGPGPLSQKGGQKGVKKGVQKVCTKSYKIKKVEKNVSQKVVFFDKKVGKNCVYKKRVHDVTSGTSEQA